MEVKERRFGRRMSVVLMFIAAYAYAGPGSGLSAFGSDLRVIAAAFFALVEFV